MTQGTKLVLVCFLMTLVLEGQLHATGKGMMKNNRDHPSNFMKPFFNCSKNTL